MRRCGDDNGELTLKFKMVVARQSMRREAFETSCSPLKNRKINISVFYSSPYGTKSRQKSLRYSNTFPLQYNLTKNVLYAKTCCSSVKGFSTPSSHAPSRSRRRRLLVNLMEIFGGEEKDGMSPFQLVLFFLKFVLKSCED